MITFTVVLWVHIIGAIGWLGAAMVFALVIGPSLQTLSPQTRLEFVIKVLPKFLRYIEAFSILTVIFGLLAIAALFNGDLSEFSLSTPLGLYISIGAVLAVVAIGLAMAVLVPTARKLISISEGLTKTPGPPPPELMAASQRLRVTSIAGLAILVLVTIFMVAGATL